MCSFYISIRRGEIETTEKKREERREKRQKRRKEEIPAFTVFLIANSPLFLSSL
jgi:hypothetical protein